MLAVPLQSEVNCSVIGNKNIKQTGRRIVWQFLSVLHTDIPEKRGPVC